MRRMQFLEKFQFTANINTGKPIKNLPEDISVIPTNSTSDIYQTVARKANTSVNRLRITKGSDGSLVPNTKNPSINDTGLRDQSIIYVKDLGWSSLISSPSLYNIESAD